MIAGDAIVSAGEHLVVSPAYLSSDPEQAIDTVYLRPSGIAEAIAFLQRHGDDANQWHEQSFK